MLFKGIQLLSCKQRLFRKLFVSKKNCKKKALINVDLLKENTAHINPTIKYLFFQMLERIHYFKISNA